MNKQWEARKCILDELRYLSEGMCISERTLSFFLNHILMVSQQFELNRIQNIGLPLTRVGHGEIVGYELLNYGYWNRILNDKTENGCWIVQPDLPPSCIEKLMIFQNGIELMSFCDLKRINFGTTALVSVGDKASHRDFELLIEHYPRAKVLACFENSIRGNILDVTAALVKKGSKAQFSIAGNKVDGEVDGKLYRIPAVDFRLSALRKLFSLKYTTAVAIKPVDVLNFNEQLIKRNTISTKN